MKILVTGCNGFLGGHVIDILTRRKHHRVTGLDSHGNLLVGKQMDSPEVVIHLAWYSSTREGQDEVHDKCRAWAEQMAYTCRQNGSVMIFASSAAVYGNGGPFDESSRCDSVDAYGRNKLGAEIAILRLLPDKHTIFRFGSLMGRGVEGGRTKTDLVVNSCAVDGWRRGRIQLWNPDDVKPILHVLDAAHLLVDAAQPRQSAEGYATKWRGTWNAAWASMPAWKIAKIAAMATEADTEFLPLRPRRSVVLECGKLRHLWKPYRGIFRAVEELRGHVESLGDKNDPTRWSTPSVPSSIAIT